MKKIHITESQLRYCIKSLKEGVTDVDITNAYTNDGKQFGGNCKKTIADAEKNGLNPNEMNVSINGSAIKEGHVYTKRELKEARRNKLMNEASKIVKKKDIIKK